MLAGALKHHPFFGMVSEQVAARRLGGQFESPGYFINYCYNSIKQLYSL
jgi:hypothetical protein